MLRDGAGRLIGAFQYARDLTERLHQAQRMEALGQLTSGVAHDFNNVLQAVQGGAALIKHRTVMWNGCAALRA